MDLLNIVIDNKKYTYVDAIILDNKNYVAYMDKECIYVSEYKVIDGEMIFDDVSDAIYKRVISEMKL